VSLAPASAYNPEAFTCYRRDTHTIAVAFDHVLAASEADAVVAAIEEALRVKRHIHVVDPGDEHGCLVCGRNVRDEVHLRVGERP